MPATDLAELQELVKQGREVLAVVYPALLRDRRGRAGGW